MSLYKNSYWLFYLWILTTPLWSVHVQAQGVDLKYDPLVIQNTLTSDVANGMFTPGDIETFQNLQAQHSLTKEELQSYFSERFAVNGIYGEQVDGTTVSWQQEKDHIDERFGKDVSLLWLSKQYQGWYEGIEAQQNVFINGGKEAESQLNTILETTPDNADTWNADQWKDFAQTKGLPGLGILLMGIYGLWRSKRDEADPFEGINEEIQASLESSDVHTSSYKTYYWDVHNDVQEKQRIEEGEALKASGLEKPKEVGSFLDEFDGVLNNKHQYTVDQFVSEARANGETITKEWYLSLAEKLYKTSEAHQHDGTRYLASRYDSLGMKVLESMAQIYASPMGYRGSRDPYIFHKYWVQPIRNQYRNTFKNKYSEEAHQKVESYNSKKTQYSLALQAYNQAKTKLFQPIKEKFRDWSRKALNYWNAMRTQKSTQVGINTKLTQISKKLSISQNPRTLDKKTIDLFIRTQTTSTPSGKEVLNPEWILETAYKKEQLEKEHATITKAIKNHQRDYNSYLSRYRFPTDKNVLHYLAQYRNQVKRLPELENELVEVDSLLQKAESSSFSGELNGWVNKKAEDLFPDWEDVTFSEEHIIEKLKELEKATTTAQKQTIIDYLKQDAYHVQAFLYRSVSRFNYYFPKYGLNYASWYKTLMDDFRNKYLHEAKKKKAVAIEKQKKAVAFFNEQKAQIIANNRFTSFLESATTSTNPLLGQVSGIVRQIQTLTKGAQEILKQTKELPYTNTSRYALDREQQVLLDQKENLSKGLQAIYNTYTSLQKGITDGLETIWSSAKSTIEHFILDQEKDIAEYWTQQQEAKHFYIQYGKTKAKAFAEMDVLRATLEQKDAAFDTLLQSNPSVSETDRLHYLGREHYYHILPALRENKYAGMVVKHGPSDGHIAMVERRNDQKYYDLQTQVQKYSTWFHDPTAKVEAIAALVQYEQALAIKRTQEWEEQYQETPPSHIDVDLLAAHNLARQQAGTTTETVTVQVEVAPESIKKTAPSKKKPISKKIKEAYTNTKSKKDYISTANTILYNWHKTEQEKQIANLETLLEPKEPESLKLYKNILVDIEVAQQSVTKLDVVLRRTVQRKQEQQSVLKRNEEIAKEWYTNWLRNGQQAADYNKYLLYNQRALDALYLIQDIEDLEAQQRTDLHNAQDALNALQGKLGREETVYGRYQNQLTIYNTRKGQQEAQREQIISTLKQRHQQAKVDAERYYYDEQAKEAEAKNQAVPETPVIPDIIPEPSVTYKEVEVDKDLQNLIASIQVEQEKTNITLSSYASNTDFRWNDPAWIQSVLQKIKDGNTHIFHFDDINPLAELNALYAAAKKEKGGITFGTQEQRLADFMIRITNAYQEQINHSPLSEEKWNIVNDKNYWFEQTGNIIRHTDKNWLDNIYTLVISNEISYEDIGWFSNEEKEALLSHTNTQYGSALSFSKPLDRREQINNLVFSEALSRNLRAQAAYQFKDPLMAHVDYAKATHEVITNYLIEKLNDLLNDGDTDPAIIDAIQKVVTSNIAHRAYDLNKTEYLDYKRVQGSALDKHGLQDSDLIDTDSGFQSVIYENDNQVIVAFAGTDPKSWDDWSTNAQQGRGKVTKQYENAKRISDQIRNSTDKHIIFTGHSLGGGLAAFVGAYSNTLTYTFNSAGVHKETLNQYDAYKESYQNIINIITPNDILTELQTESIIMPNAIGQQVQYTNNSIVDLLPFTLEFTGIDILNFPKIFIGAQQHGKY